MALAPFYGRIYGAIGGRLQVSRDSLQEILGHSVIGLRLGPNADDNSRWTADFAVNLLSRIYPVIGIDAGDDDASRLRSIATAINPKIDITENTEPTFTISIGGPTCLGAIHASSTGWVVHIGADSAFRGGPANPYAATAAAAFACAALFRRIFVNAPPEADFSLSLLDYGSGTGDSRPLSSVDLGKVVVAGIGAVGSAAISVWSRDAGLRGTLWVLDPERLETSNLQRYAGSTFRDVGTRKVVIAKRAFKGAGISVKAVHSTLERFASKHGDQLETICVSVDNVESRRVAQALLPRLVINGWTGEQSLGASWHMLSRDAACLACLYHPTGPGLSATEQAARTLGIAPARAAVLWVTRQPLSDEELRDAARALGVTEETLAPWKGKPLGDVYTDVICGAVPIELPGLERIETVPLAHQSALAGVLMAAELIKRLDPELAAVSQEEPLIMWDDVLKPPPSLWVRRRPREPGCICTDPVYQQAYQTKWQIPI